jgi:superfamily II DNA/RNA helicase
MRIGYVSLHGGIPTRRRGKLISRFRDDPQVKVFLSTDAGGVGLNLQAASAVINIEPPWNPARLEQRIGRVHRMGQSRPVLAVHLLTEGSIEERVWETIRLKKALFTGLFDGTASEVSFEKLGRKPMLEVLKEIFPQNEPAPAQSGSRRQQKAPKQPDEVARSGPSPVTDVAPPDGATRAVGMLLEAGLKFLESWAAAPRAAESEKPSLPVQAPRPQGRFKPDVRRPEQPRTLAETIEESLAELVKQDPVTRLPTLSIALPPSLTAERIAQSLATALRRLTGA